MHNSSYSRIKKKKKNILITEPSGGFSLKIGLKNNGSAHP